ncbi:ATP-dependent DNA helicase [Clostridium sp. KNHs205]|uniref:ATP-dependent DNA helicase n=1 Tax=Clostridium sp. KNHs205 TaxID=1449050 RepID=UPI00051C8E68|nr:ATP-dependent DNA helicase [Clostridium sp. KNHs205]
MCARRIEPFEYKNKTEFQEKLVEWIGDVLYDILPDHGYEVRDEQIFTAFQIADAFCENQVHLAEAGLGTGKTIAYLLSAIPYARMSGKPVVIACATAALQEQLVHPEGDYNRLSKLLGLEIDARMAKDPGQYICDVKMEEYTSEQNRLANEIKQWMSQTRLGERSEMPTIPDGIWKKISWDEGMDCDTCLNRGYCKLVKAREHYRAARDLIIVDHETFFKDLWTRAEHMAEGKLPILPGYSAVVFDEGHKVLLPASIQAGYQIDREDMESIVEVFEEIQGARNSFMTATVRMNQTMGQFFMAVKKSVIRAESTERLSIERKEDLLKAANHFRKALDGLLLELQIEQELYFESVPAHLIQAYEGQIERAIRALDSFLKEGEENSIPWLNRKDGSFWIVPRKISKQLNLHLFQKKLPVVFTSATLSNEGDFDYFIRTVGLDGVSKSTIGSPFDLEEQVTVYLDEKAASMDEKAASMDEKAVGMDEKADLNIEKLVYLLKKNDGHSLVLTNTLSQVRKIRKSLEGYSFPFEILWEDLGERGYLVNRFREEENTVLIGANFWEGIDVPGDALTQLIVWQLPFPVLDPLLEASRKEVMEQGLDPVKVIDYPEMGLKLKQGCGRLIRTESDKGKIVILDRILNTPWEKFVRGALPAGAKVMVEEL